MFLKEKTTYVAWLLLALLVSGCASIGKRSQSPQHVDVIIVGAGMSGLTAAKALLKANKNILVLEAQDRIGGRALLSHQFKVPIDLGAAWFHGVDENPLVPIADQMGFERVDTELNGPIYVGSRKATKKEIRACDRTLDKVDAAMEKTRRQGKDRSVASILPQKDPCIDLIASNIGALENGAEPDKISAITAGLFDSENDDFVRQGIGAFVAAYGKEVPVRLNSVVNAVDYDATGVTVRLTSGERFYAHRVLVTVSTGVLAAGKIAFNPPLPSWKHAAIKSLPMGLLNKVVIQFKSDIFKDTPKNSWVLWDGPKDNNMAFVIRPLNAPIAVGFYGGEQAKELEKNDVAALSQAKDVLRKMFGEEVLSEFDSYAITKWGQNPWTMGSYSYVTPGASTMHVVLEKPVADRVFFAGEACSRPEFNGSLHGAYESGLSASKMILDSLAVRNAQTQN